MHFKPIPFIWEEASKKHYRNFIIFLVIGIFFVSIIIFIIFYTIIHGFSIMLIGIVLSTIGLINFVLAYIFFKMSEEGKGKQRIVFELNKIDYPFIKQNVWDIYNIVNELLTELKIEFKIDEGRSFYTYFTSRIYKCNNNYSLEVGYSGIRYKGRRPIYGLIFLIGPINNDNQEEIKKVQREITRKINEKLYDWGNDSDK